MRYEQIGTGAEYKVGLVFVHTLDLYTLDLATPKSRHPLPEIFNGMEYWIPDSPFALLETTQYKSEEEQPDSYTGVQPTANGLILSPGDAIFSAILKKGEGPTLEWDFVQKPRSIVRLLGYA